MGRSPAPSYRRRWRRLHCDARVLVCCPHCPFSGFSAPQAPETPDIHFAVTPQPLADAMLTLAHVTKDDVVYDLGSGDGRIVVLAAQKYGARGVGIEIDRALVEISRTVAREGEVADRVTLRRGRSVHRRHLEGDGRHALAVDHGQPAAGSQAQTRAAARHADRVAPVSDRRVAAGSDGPGRRGDPATVDDPAADNADHDDQRRDRRARRRTRLILCALCALGGFFRA